MPIELSILILSSLALWASVDFLCKAINKNIEKREEEHKRNIYKRLHNH